MVSEDDGPSRRGLLGATTTALGSGAALVLTGCGAGRTGANEFAIVLGDILRDTDASPSRVAQAMYPASSEASVFANGKERLRI